MQDGALRILLLGSGGREHALAWKMAQSPLVAHIQVLPGSDGIATLDKVTCAAGDALDVAKGFKPDLIVVGPEKPAADGVVDALEAQGFAVMGPSQAAAQLESSKIFSKNFMVAEGIPTAKAVTCDGYDAAIETLKGWGVEKDGIVIKADGLAAGKGVVVTFDRAEATQTLHDFMQDPTCTVNADRVLFEEVLKGREVSAFALCDGENFIPLGYACDYKRVNDGHLGPNTGGMGGYAPKGWPSDAARAFVNEKVFAPVLAGMKKRGTPFKGILFAGLMVDGDDVRVIEFNVRFGDPEAQILMPLIDADIVPLFMAAAKGELASCTVPALNEKTAVHVVMVSEGYPDVAGKGMRLGQTIEISANNDNAQVFFAGVKKQDGAWTNTGGRVLGVTALGATLEEARTKAYAEIDRIKFNGAHWRKDIGR